MMTKNYLRMLHQRRSECCFASLIQVQSWSRLLTAPTSQVSGTEKNPNCSECSGCSFQYFQSVKSGRVRPELMLNKRLVFQDRNGCRDRNPVVAAGVDSPFHLITSGNRIRPTESQ